MSLVTPRYRMPALLCSLALALPAAPARAGLPNNLSDMPYQSYEWGSEQLRYRDGLYHQGYHNYNRTDAYSDGYNTGQEARHEETHSYRGNHGRYSGYHPYVAVNDLIGMRASTADAELRSRGFNDVGGYKEGGRSHVTWYNRGTHQCVEAVTREGEIRRLNDIDEGNGL